MMHFPCARRIASLFFSLLAALFALELPAAALQEGEIVVADFSGVLRIDPVSGTSTQLDPLWGWGIAVDETHDIFVTDAARAVYRIPASGTPGTFVEHQDLANTLGIAIEDSGNLLVVTSQSRLYRIDRTTRTLQLLTQAGQMVDPTGVAVGPGGDILVIDAWQIVRVDPVSGVQTVLSGTAQAGVVNRTRAGGDDICVTATGAIYITDAADGVYQIDAQNGAQSQVKDIDTSTYLWDPTWIAVEANGDFLLSDVNAGSWGSAIVRVAASSGSEQLLSDDPEVEGTKGIAVVPAPEPSARLLQAAALGGVAALARRRSKRRVLGSRRGLGL